MNSGNIEQDVYKQKKLNGSEKTGGYSMMILATSKVIKRLIRFDWLEFFYV